MDAKARCPDNMAMHAKPDLRVEPVHMVTFSGSVILVVIWLKRDTDQLGQ